MLFTSVVVVDSVGNAESPFFFLTARVVTSWLPMRAYTQMKQKRKEEVWKELHNEAVLQYFKSLAEK